MISSDAKPIGHISPYKRVELGAWPKKPEPKWVPVPIPPLYVSQDGGMTWTVTKDIYCG